MAGLGNDLGKLQRGADALRAALELALARLRHAATPARKLPLGAAACDGLPLTLAQQALLERITYVVPRAARRMPFRSDCMVQALAARRWLARAGIAATIHLGGRKHADGRFEAHAWLTVGEAVITGWDIERFAEFAEFPLKGESLADR